MRLKFLDRFKEIEKLERTLKRRNPSFTVIYGRRRCGKSRLLQETIKENDIFFMADQQEAQLQREGLAKEIDRVVPDFSAASYPSWESILYALNNSLKERVNLIIDEFPYIVQNAAEITGVLQKFIDTVPDRKFNLIICGSSQRMMQGLVLDASSPLYGRADEVFKVRSLKVAWIQEAFELNDIEAIEAYSVWGGVPRYWELAKEYSNLKDAIINLILDRDGIFHEEPLRLFLDEMRTATQSLSILTLIGSGYHRLSEIAGRLEKKAVNLSRPLSNLIDLGYVRRELPFGESVRSTKRTLYKINDPFMNFYFRFVQTNKSLLEFDLTEKVFSDINKRFPQYVAEIWEVLVRESIPTAKIAGKYWKPAQRWWGAGINRKPLEIDVVAESIDEKSLLIGEIKWSDNDEITENIKILRKKIENFSSAKDYDIIPAIWIKSINSVQSDFENIFTPRDVLRCLK
jgi:hypothetical protein